MNQRVSYTAVGPVGAIPVINGPVSADDPAGKEICKDCQCAEIFNALSRSDRVKLQAAALTKALTGFIRDDTEKYPWRYPFYAGYLFIVLTPFPVPFASSFVIGATVAWARYGKSTYAERLYGRITGSFNHKSIICDHMHVMTVDPEKPHPAMKVKNLSLMWDTTAKSSYHTWETTVHAAKALKNWALRNLS